ncbi:hypothetical protein K504DRAFT_388600, partial [Pleomassaria siparia CBS 279.74]
RSIKTSTYGIMFMGTPHQGGSGVPLGKLLVNVASVFVAADDRLLKHLERDSETLQQQLGQYGQISGEFMTKFAYEVYKTPVAWGSSIMVVPRASAVLPGAADAEPIAIHTDHINMVKFTSKEDNGYETVSGHLQIMVQSAEMAITLRWNKEARISSEESFSIVFSLSEVYETEHFVARNEMLEAMHNTLSHSTNRQAVTLHGLGGMGKTQLAIAYTKAHRHDHSAIFWLNIKNKASVKQSYSRIAERILQEHPSASQLGGIKDDSPLDDKVAAVKRWLEYSKNTHWLMVFDNYDNPKTSGNTIPGAVDISEFLPKAYHGSIIVTTRSSNVSVGQRIRVGKLKDVRDSLQIVSDSSCRKGVIDDPSAIELVEELDGLPLALATAGAYLNQCSTSIADYLRLYRTSWEKLQRTSPQIKSYEDRKLYSTWQLSLDHVMQQNRNSAMLLRLWAYFDNQDLWFELLEEGSNDGPKWLRQITEDQLSFNETVRVLGDYGLVEVAKSTIGVEVGPVGYGMHSCVHSWTIHVVNQEWDGALADLAMKRVGNHIPYESTPRYWVTQRRLLRHVERCWGFCMLTLYIFNSLGVLYAKLGRLKEAEEIYEMASEQEKILFFKTVNNTGIVYADLGYPKRAETMYQEARQGFEELLGRDHTLTLETLHNLYLVYKSQRKHVEAAKIYQQKASREKDICIRRYSAAKTPLLSRY